MLPNEKLYQYRYDFDAQQFVFTGKVAENDSDMLKFEAEQDPKEFYRWYQLATDGDNKTTAKEWEATLKRNTNTSEFYRCSVCGKIFWMDAAYTAWLKEHDEPVPTTCSECSVNK